MTGNHPMEMECKDHYGLEDVSRLFGEYLDEVSRLYRVDKLKGTGIEGYCLAVAKLFLSGIEAMQETVKKPTMHLKTLTGKDAGGCPNLYIAGESPAVYGYIDVLPPGGNLRQTEKSYRFQRYIEVFDNVVLTNLLEFRLYRFQKLAKRVKIANKKKLDEEGKVPRCKNEVLIYELLETFFFFRLLWHNEGYCHLYRFLVPYGEGMREVVRLEDIGLYDKKK